MASEEQTVKALESPKPTNVWSQETRKDGWTKSVTVEKLENQGYLVIIQIYGNDKEGNYKSVTRKLYSPTNILDQKKIESPTDKLISALIRKHKS
jgi:hypothetical protein